jgi:hypothetical protein
VRLRVQIEHVFHPRHVLPIDLRDTPHLPSPGLELVLVQPSTHPLPRQRGVFGELYDRTRQKLQGPALAPLRGARAGSGHQQRLFLAGELAARSRPRLLAQRALEMALYEATLGPVHGGRSRSQRSRDRRLALACVRRQQNLRSFDPTNRRLAPRNPRPQLAPLFLAQLYDLPYVHRCPPAGHRRLPSKFNSHVERRSPSQLHPQAGAVPGLHLRVLAHPRASPSPARSPALLRLDSPHRSPDQSSPSSENS